MEKRRGTYTKEFKESAVELYRSGGKPYNDVAKDLGISPENLRRWINEAVLKYFPCRGPPETKKCIDLKKKTRILEKR